jgi:ribosome silencing factor RsfS/YbeB/iojap
MNLIQRPKEQSLNLAALVITGGEPVEQSNADDHRHCPAGCGNKLWPVVLVCGDRQFYRFLCNPGANERQVRQLPTKYSNVLRRMAPAARVEGRKTAEWILLDYGDFIVHVFADKARKFYDLERLWREAKRLELPPALVSQPSSLRTE